MDQHGAVAAFGALSQETRLCIVRLLVRAGADGMSAGAIAETLDVSPSNMSFHLKDLEHADLIAARRAARSIIYAAKYSTLRTLVEFLMKDCCAGHPEICKPGRAPERKRKKAYA